MCPPEESPPEHVAIIMDGNGRWARQRGLPRRDGHRAGAESVREIIEAAKEAHVKHLTLYAFSSENWNRPKNEITALMTLLERFLKTKAPELQKQNVALKAIGQLDRLPENCRQQLDKVIAATAENTSLNLILALSYGGREELTEATQKIAHKVSTGTLTPQDITKETITQHLYTSPYPDPDLLIRTSGELRLSNFLLWQLSYAEIIITKKYWPDFKRLDFHDAIEEYHRRHRRFGAL